MLASCCISPPFGGLSTTRGLITYVLLTRAPLYRGRIPFSLDLHVLGAPLTFVLSQDQTLQLNPVLARVSYGSRLGEPCPPRAYASCEAKLFRAVHLDHLLRRHRLCRASHSSANALCSFVSTFVSQQSRLRPGGTGTRDVYRGNRTQFSRTEGRQRRRPEGCL